MGISIKDTTSDPPDTSPKSESSSSDPPPQQSPPVQLSPPPPPSPHAGNSVSPPAPPGQHFVPPSPNKTPTPPPVGDTSLVKHLSSASTNKGVIAGIVVAALLFIIIAACCLCIFCRRRRKKKGERQLWNTRYPEKHYAVNIPAGIVAKAAGPTYETSGWGSQPQPPPPPPASREGGLNNRPGQSSFSYEELEGATDGFAGANKLGEGGFGLVHKGVLATNGKEVAIKSLKPGSGQGEREFHSEVDIISRVHHRHLVSLVGYCISHDKRLLVYDFVPNNNLEFHLYKSGNVLDFSTRLRIALGAAKGLAYLHEDCQPRIIHRDIKTSNILLDYNFEAQVADFGLARLTTDTSTYVSTRVMGTFGYLAPEYAESGKLTEKSDVFSFGIVLLELITGRHPVDPNYDNHTEDTLVDWARPLLSKALEKRNYQELADPRLQRSYNTQDMLGMVACAAACIRHSSKRRPKMSQIVRALEGDMSLDNLLDGGLKTEQSIARKSEYDTIGFNADMQRFEKVDITSDGSSSSEYDLNTSSSASSNDDNSHRLLSSDKRTLS